MYPVDELVRYSVKLSISVPPARLLQLGRERRSRQAALERDAQRQRNPTVKPTKMLLFRANSVKVYAGALLAAVLAYVAYRYSWF